MNAPFFIARRLLAGQPDSAGSGQARTRPIIRIAIAGISLGMAVMIVAVSIVTGFHEAIKDKVIGFSADIVITRFGNLNALEPEPIPTEQDFYPSITSMPGVRHIQVYATKAGIIRTDDDIEGIVVKGVGSDYDWSFFRKHLQAGELFTVADSARSDLVLISDATAKKLRLGVGDRMEVFFIQGEQQRARIFRVSGIFKTGLEDFDKRFIIADIGHIQRLNQWAADEVAGFELFVSDYAQLDRMDEVIYHAVGHDLFTATVHELYPQMFDWLELQNVNVQVIIILMLLVAGFNMVSALLIIIIERVSTIGILKAIGMSDRQLRSVFLLQALYLTGIGMLWGNVIGIGLCLLQHHFGFITLSEESYYVSVVPVNLQLWHVALLNIGAITACFLMLLLPSFIVGRISPLKAIRFS